MAHEKKNEEVPTGKKSTPIFYDPPGFSPVYTDNAVVQHTENEFILSFFMAEYPYPSAAEIDSETGRIKAPSEAPPVRARCVSRVIMSPNQMIKLVRALQDNLARYIKKVEQAEMIEEGEEES